MGLYTGDKNIGASYLAAKKEYQPPMADYFNYQRIIKDAARQQSWKMLQDERNDFRSMQRERWSSGESDKRQTAADKAAMERQTKSGETSVKVVEINKTPFEKDTDTSLYSKSVELATNEAKSGMYDDMEDKGSIIRRRAREIYVDLIRRKAGNEKPIDTTTGIGAGISAGMGGSPSMSMLSESPAPEVPQATGSSLSDSYVNSKAMKTAKNPETGEIIKFVDGQWWVKSNGKWVLYQ